MPPKRDDPVTAAFGRRVQELRKARKWSQEQLAERADLDRTYVVGVETGKRNPSLKAINMIAEGLGVELAELFQGVQSARKTRPDVVTPRRTPRRRATR